MSHRPADRREHRAARARGGDALLLPRLRDERDRRAGAAGRARRPQAGAPARAVLDARGRPAAEPAVPQGVARGRRRDGPVPPARRLGHLRHAGAPRPGLRDALPARRAAGQLRLDRQRPGGGHALHRGAPRRAWPPRCSATSTRTPSTSGPTTTSRARSRSSSRRASRTCWSTARPASRSAWPPTSRRTTCASRSTRWSPTSTTPTSTSTGLMKHIKGPDFPTGGIIVGHSGIREAYETGRGRVVVRGKAHIEPMERGKERDHRHRDALPGAQGRRARRRQRPDQEDRRAGPERAHQGDLRPPRRVGPVGHPAGDRAQARRPSRRSCSTSSTSTRRCRRRSA